VGQISYPILNRFGYSMYWNNMWDNINNYSKFFLKSLFFNSIFFNFFNFYLSLNFFFYTFFFEQNLRNARIGYFSKLKNIDLSKIHKPNKFYQTNVSDALAGRIRILVFSNWYIIITHLYLSEAPLDESSEEEEGGFIPHSYTENTKINNYIQSYVFYKNNLLYTNPFNKFYFNYI
jgi:hypothetical protein